MKRFASELEFIARIRPDGGGTDPVEPDQRPYFDRELELTRLSISSGTYLASGLNSYVVRLKNPPETGEDSA